MDNNNITHTVPDLNTSSAHYVIKLMTSPPDPPPGPPGPPALQFTDPIKAVMMVYNIVMLVIGVFGNMAVLYLSLRHRAIEMDRITIVLIENLALADIMISLLFYVPMLITIPTEKWLFGDALCWFNGFFSSHIPFMVEILIITTISCYRLWVLKKPPGARKNINMTHVKLLISALWGACFVPVIYWIAAGCSTFYFKHSFICWSSNHLPSSPTYLSTKIFTGFYVGLPMIVVFLTNVKILWTMVRNTLKAGASLMTNIRPAITISLICWACLFSYFPLFTLIALKTTKSPIPKWFPIFQTFAKGLHVMVNPFIYVATNGRFRRYISRVVSMRRTMRSYVATQSNCNSNNQNSARSRN